MIPHHEFIKNESIFSPACLTPLVARVVVAKNNANYSNNNSCHLLAICYVLSRLLRAFCVSGCLFLNHSVVLDMSHLGKTWVGAYLHGTLHGMG